MHVGKILIYLPLVGMCIHFTCMYVCTPLVCLVSVKARGGCELQIVVSCHQGLHQEHSVLLMAKLSLQLLGKIPD